MKELYQEKDYIQNSLAVLQNEIEELERISVYNGDVFLDEIHGMITRYHDIKEKMFIWLEKRSVEEYLENGGTIEDLPKEIKDLEE